MRFEEAVGKKIRNKKTGERSIVNGYADRPSVHLTNGMSFCVESPVADEWELVNDKPEDLTALNTIADWRQYWRGVQHSNANFLREDNFVMINKELWNAFKQNDPMFDLDSARSHFKGMRMVTLDGIKTVVEGKTLSDKEELRINHVGAHIPCYDRIYVYESLKLFTEWLKNEENTYPSDSTTRMREKAREIFGDELIKRGD